MFLFLWPECECDHGRGKWGRCPSALPHVLILSCVMLMNFPPLLLLHCTCSNLSAGPTAPATECCSCPPGVLGLMTMPDDELDANVITVHRDSTFRSPYTNASLPPHSPLSHCPPPLLPRYLRLSSNLSLSTAHALRHSRNQAFRRPGLHHSPSSSSTREAYPHPQQAQWQHFFCPYQRCNSPPPVAFFA